MVIPSVSALNFVSVTLSMGILFPILRRSEVSTLWSSFFLILMCFGNCIWGILSYWANIHLSKIQFTNHMKLKKEDQSVDTSVLLRRGIKMPMGENTKTKKLK